MTNLEEFIKITTEYDDKLFKIFQREIDISIKDCKERKLNAVDTFINVNNKINSLYANLAIAHALIPNELSYDSSIIPVSETLISKIYEYVDPLTISASNEIEQLALQVLDSTTTEELQDNYKKLNKEIEKLDQSKTEFIYEGIVLKRK